MPAVTPLMVKELREKTGAGMLDCKKALEASNCDIEEAVKWLREKGIAKAEKKASRVAAEGLCSFALNGNSAVVFEVNSETDFVAQNEKFTSLIAKVGEVIANSDAMCTNCALEINVEGKTLNEVINIDEEMNKSEEAKEEKKPSNRKPNGPKKPSNRKPAANKAPEAKAE